MTKISKLLFLSVVLLPVLIVSAVVQAQNLSMPSGDVILTIDGNIDFKNNNGHAVFDLQMLQALEIKTYETHTPWSDNVYRFRGATFESVLNVVGAKEGSELTLIALDGYQIDISWEDATAFKPILAYSRNNVPMSRRDRGPLWLVFPLDDHHDLRNARYDNFWVWQLTRIEVK